MEKVGQTTLYTLQGACKKCGGGFTYTRLYDLRGQVRTVCDGCKPKRHLPRQPKQPKTLHQDSVVSQEIVPIPGKAEIE